MNKKLVALVAAAMMSISAGSVFAATNPVDVNSSISIHYRANTKDGTPDNSGTKLTFKSAATIGLTSNIDFYGRVAAQKVNSLTNAGKDYVANQDSIATVDQFGFIIKGGDNNFVYKIGRQDIALGANETLYSSGGYIGEHSFADGITITGKSGVFDLKAVAAKEDGTNTYKNRIFGFEASFKPSDAWALGTTLAKYDQSDKNTSYYAVNAGYTFSPKANVMAEYAKSNEGTDNKAYNIAFNYTFDNKLSGYIINHKTERLATPISDQEWTGFDSNEKGFYYGLDYKFAKGYTWSVMYKANQIIAGTDAGKDKTSLRTTLTYKF